jgi:hypothetical protein
MMFAHPHFARIRLVTLLALAAVLGSAACTTTESGSGAPRVQSQVRPAPTLGVGY